MKHILRAFLLATALLATALANGQTQGPQYPRQESDVAVGNALPATTAPTQGPQYQKQESGVPVLTGFVGLGSEFEPGQQQVLPAISPILLVPIGSRILFESEAEFEGTYTHMTGQPWDHTWDKGIEYVQADVFVNKYLTLVGGRFLTPFGTFNERLHSGWIRNIQTAPFITALEMTDSNGGQARGAVSINRNLNINYAAYFSASSDTDWFVSDRAAGGRVGLFFPTARFEVGGSYQRKLGGDTRRNLVGVDWTWQLKPIPLDIRGEFARDPLIGKGYWVEGAYRMRRMPFAKAFMKKSQAGVRMEQFFVSPLMGTMDTGDMEIPSSDAKRVFAGWSYWIRPDVRANFAYGREFNRDEGDHNVWTVGLTYRFAFPLWR